MSVKTKCVTVFSRQLTVKSVLSCNCLRADLDSWPCAFLSLFVLYKIAGLLALARTRINL